MEKSLNFIAQFLYEPCHRILLKELFISKFIFRSNIIVITPMQIFIVIILFKNIPRGSRPRVLKIAKVYEANLRP